MRFGGGEADAPAARAARRVGSGGTGPSSPVPPKVGTPRAAADMSHSVVANHADQLWEQIRASDADAFGLLFDYHGTFVEVVDEDGAFV